MGDGRDGAIEVSSEDDDELELDDGEGEGDKALTPQQELEQLRESNARLEAAVRRNNAENRRYRQLAAAAKKHGIEDLDAWAEKLKAEVKAGAITPAQADQLSGGVVEGSESPTEPPEGQGTGVKPPAGLTEEEVARRVQLELERREAQNADRADALEEALRATAIEVVLKDAKFNGTLEKALRVMDLDKVEVGTDGKVTGVTEAVAALQQEIPEWFRPARPERPTVRGSREMDGGEKPRTPPKPQSWDQRISQQIAGR